MSKRVYVTMKDGNSAGSIVMQTGEQIEGDHRATNGATMAEVMAALAEAGYTIDEPEEELREDDHLSRLTRSELDALAAERGVEAPEDLDNKEAVIAAIEAAQ